MGITDLLELSRASGSASAMPFLIDSWRAFTCLSRVCAGQVAMICSTNSQHALLISFALDWERAFVKIGIRREPCVLLMMNRTATKPDDAITLVELGIRLIRCGSTLSAKWSSLLCRFCERNAMVMHASLTTWDLHKNCMSQPEIIGLAFGSLPQVFYRRLESRFHKTNMLFELLVFGCSRQNY